MGDGVAGVTRVEKAARSRAGEVFELDGWGIEDVILNDCRHSWEKASVGPLGSPVADGEVSGVMVCWTCDGMIESCLNCKGFHMVDQGLGGVSMMPELVDEAWVIAEGCAGVIEGRALAIAVVVHELGWPQEFARYVSVEDRLGDIEEVCEGEPSGHPDWERLQALFSRRPTAYEFDTVDGFDR